MSQFKHEITKLINDAVNYLEDDDVSNAFDEFLIELDADMLAATYGPSEETEPAIKKLRDAIEKATDEEEKEKIEEEEEDEELEEEEEEEEEDIKDVFLSEEED